MSILPFEGYNRQKGTVKRWFPKHVHEAEKNLSASRNPDEMMLYHYIRSKKGSGDLATYEQAKRLIVKYPSLSANYDKWVRLVIDFLDV